MRVRNHKLVGNDGRNVAFDQSPNRSDTRINPEYLVMHYTAGGSLQSAVNWFNNPDADASAHLVIGHDGTVVQMGLLNEKLWHAGGSRLHGRSGFNNFSIGIEIVNWGKLTGGVGNWRSWTNTRIDDARVAVTTHKSDTDPAGWEIFYEAQMQVALEAAIAICKEYNIPPSNLIGHDDVSAYRGKRDPGPLFDLDRFRGRVFGRADAGDQGLFEITAVNGLHLRTGASMDSPSLVVLPHMTKVEFIQSNGVWWLVAIIDANGEPDTTGWVHSRWLAAI